MSTAERMKIMDYLPPEEQQKVLNLVIRLKEQSEAKQNYISLYNSAQSALQALTLKYNKLKDQNQYLKQQVHKSFEIVSEVRKNFRADKLRSSCKEKKKNEQEEQSSSEGENQENRLSTSNQTLIQRLPKPIAKSPLEKYRPPMTSSKKMHTFNLSSNDLNKTNLSGSKSKQIEDLRREVRALHQGKKMKESKQKQLREKRRLVDQIKSRYRGDDQQNGQQMSNFKESTIQRIDISDAFENDQHQSIGLKQKDRMIRIKSNQKNNQSKRMAVQQRNQPKMYEVRPKPQGQKGHIVTSNDYGDVLEMINCYNL